MGIIAVNISRSRDQGIGLLEATACCWKLNINRVIHYDFVVGVQGGEIANDGMENAFFRKIDVELTADQMNQRVRFILVPCNPNEINLINQRLVNQNLRNFTTKYFNF